MGKQNPNIRQGLAVAVILLFIGVAFAPSINAKMNNEPIPDLDCEGDIYWIGDDLEPGDVLTGDFTVGNIGEPNSELDWRIMSCPFWGTWTFSPESGTGLTPEDGFITVNVELILEVEINETLHGEIGIQNVDNESDICYIYIQIKKKSIDEIEELEWIRHPILYAIFRTLGTTRSLRFAFNFMMAVFCTEGDGFGALIITKPILFSFFIIRAATHQVALWYWVGFWEYISETLEWNWEFP